VQAAQKVQTSHPPNPGAPGRALSQARPQRTSIFIGVGGMIPTARVQRGPSEAARCASTGIVPGTPLPFFSILPLVSVAKGSRLSCGSPARAGRFKPVGHVVKSRNQFVDCGSLIPLLLSFIE